MSRCSEKLRLLNLLPPDRGPGPVRRFPAGFWASFNQWWHGDFARQGQRPSSTAISKWHADNAVLVWGDQAVSYAETQRHANRMKCRRSGMHLPSKRNQEDDDDVEEDDSLMDTAVVDRDTGPYAAMGLDTMGDASSGASGADALVPAAAPARTRSRRLLDINAHSDPPGAIFGGLALGMYSDPPRAAAGLGGALAYLNADSDIPAPAAAPTEPFTSPLLPGCAYVKPEQQPLWMQPDPTGPMNGLPYGAPLATSSTPGSTLPGGLSWDSSFSVAGQPAGAAAAYPLSLRNSSVSGAVYGAAPRGPKRVRPAEACATSGVHCAGGGAPAPESYLRTNPFGELSAAAGASAGLQAASAPPAALDAAALLGHGGAAMSHMSYLPPAAPMSLSLHMQQQQQQQPSQQQQLQQVGDAGLGPAWMRQNSIELEALLAELGIGGPAPGQPQQNQHLQLEQALGAAAAPLVLRSALASPEPLSLPPPRPQRGAGVDALLTRGLGRLEAAGGGGAGGCMSTEQVRQQLLRRGGGGGGGGSGGARPRASGVEGLTAIDSMPIEALLM